jgi:cytoskeletal protein RodZ
MQDNLGSYLRSERETRSIALGDVSRTTKIPVRSLERLEDGDYEGLPGEVFVRGFIKSYARCVGIDDESALIIYDAERERRRTEQVPGDDAETSLGCDESAHTRRRVGLAVFVVIVLIIATLALSLLLRRPHHSDGALSTGPSPQMEVLAS